MRLEKMGDFGFNSSVVGLQYLQSTHLAGWRFPEEATIPIICWLLGIDMGKIPTR